MNFELLASRLFGSYLVSPKPLVVSFFSAAYAAVDL